VNATVRVGGKKIKRKSFIFYQCFLIFKSYKRKTRIENNNKETFNEEKIRAQILYITIYYVYKMNIKLFNDVSVNNELARFVCGIWAYLRFYS
jgi:hypothetical protein